MWRFFTTKRVVLILFSILLISIVSYGLYLYINVKATMKVIQTPIIIEETSSTTAKNQEATSPEQINLAENVPQPITLLLLGIDQYENSNGRADTILVLTVNPQSEKMTMLSIPRDTYTEIVGMDFHDKINHSYAFGGLEMAHATVENLLDIDVDYVVSINMEGFMELVDLLNGVEIENNMAFSSEGFDYPKGKLTLAGDEALNYVRMRYDDPLGDFGRQIRQRLVVESILAELSSLNLVWQVPSILETIRGNVETNITLEDIKLFARHYKPALKNMEQLNFNDGEGRLEKGIWYYFPSEDELDSIRLQLESSLAVDEN